MKMFEDFMPSENKENNEESISDYFMGLSASNTVSDVVTELYDAMFREILGDDTMDRALGSFDRKELFRVMAKIFLQDGNQKLYKQLIEQN